MKIALAAATVREIEATQQYLSERLYLKGHHRFTVILTGVGPVATTHILTREWIKQKPDIAIQAGIAGSFHPMFEPGQVVAVREERMGDLGVMEGEWKDLFDMGLADPDLFPYQDGNLVNPHTDLLQKSHLELVRGLTVSQVSTDPQVIRHLYHKYHPQVESMEGAAFHHVCLAEQVPFIQLRAISNRVGDRNKNNWRIQESIQLLNEQLIQLINRLAEHPHT